MAKSLQKTEAQHLRKEGKSIKFIAHNLNVSTSTASLWCRDIKLTSGQIKLLEKNSKDPFYGRRLTYSLKQHLKMIDHENTLISNAILQTGKLSEREKLIAGTALYWAEGFKKDKMVGFANSDPQMIIFILNWLRSSLNIPPERIKLRIGINESHKSRAAEIQNYWSDITRIPPTQFYKPYFQKVAWKKHYEHPENYFGILRIRVLKSTDLLRQVKGYILGINRT